MKTIFRLYLSWHSLRTPVTLKQKMLMNKMTRTLTKKKSKRNPEDTDTGGTPIFRLWVQAGPGQEDQLEVVLCPINILLWTPSRPAQVLGFILHNYRPIRMPNRYYTGWSIISAPCLSINNFAIFWSWRPEILYTWNLKLYNLIH